MIRLERRFTLRPSMTPRRQSLDLMIDRVQGVAIWFSILAFTAGFWTLSFHAMGIL